MLDISEHFWATEASLELELDLRSTVFVLRSALIRLSWYVLSSNLHSLHATGAATSLAAQRPDDLEDLLAADGLQDGHLKVPANRRANLVTELSNRQI